jgi:hypothetical protein
MTDTTDTTPPEAETPEVEQPTAPESTDDQLGDAGQKALKAEREKRREAERQAAEARDKAASLEAAELRREVAAEKGLTADQAKFLDGENREALEARADALLEAFPKSSRRSPHGQVRTGATGDTEPADPGAIADEVTRSW